MKVPLLDLKAQFAPMREEILSAVTEVFDTQYFIMGPRVGDFECAMAGYVGTPYALGVSSGTDALLLALMTIECGSEDEVVTTPYTFFATAGSIARTGARPVFVDIDPQTYNIDTTAAAEACTKKTRAIMPVHLYGQCADMTALRACVKGTKIQLIEDAAQAIGAKMGDEAAGTMSDFGCFSFFPSKNLGGAGDGGLITMQDEELFKRAHVLRVHGGHPKYYHHFIGGNFRLDALQAVVLEIKLKYLDQWHEGRRRNAAFYDAAFADYEEIVTPYVAPENYMIYNQYVVRVPERDTVLNALLEAGIGCEIYYPVPLHLQKCFAYLGYKQGDFPHAEKAAFETLALPIYPELTDDQKSYVAETLIAAVRG